YELCKEMRQPELQSTLLQIRRRLLEALHESLNLYSENAELHQQLSDARAELSLLRQSSAHPAMPGEAVPGAAPRKLS
ncbi:MAG TPA: hypothetical protein VFN79_03215, partial [Steroidobacteraceae bacterium]|nr:hypothetical protein [Steroidobacteraceae bacterium]